MVRLFILLAVLALAVVIYALIECIRSRPHEVRSISKPGWILTIILVPLIGALMWFMWGRPRAGSRQAQPSPRPAAPDDDIAFLRTLDAQRRAYLLERIDGVTQTLATTTELDIFSEAFIQRATVWHVTDGQIDTGKATQNGRL